MSNSYDYPADSAHGYGFAADAAVAERVDFIRKTYLHLGGSILLFMGLLSLFLTNDAISGLFLQLINNVGMMPFFIGVFVFYMVVSWIARSWAANSTSPAMQYAGLLFYAFAEAVIFTPLLMILQFQLGAGPANELIMTAGFITLVMFGGLTATVFITKADFSFLRNALIMGSFAAFGFIIISFFFNFSIGIELIFTALMIVLMCGYILYDTSNILHHYRTDQYVAAALALFAAVATLFWYVIRLLWILQGDD